MLTRPYTLSLVAVLLLLPVLALGCSNAEADQPAPDTRVPVRTAPVVADAEALPLRVSGRLASKAEMTLSFKIGGIVEQVLVEEGQRVQKGQRLARLNLAEIDAQVMQAQSGFDKASRDLDRAERLLRDSVVTRTQAQDARTAVDIAQAQLDIAQFNRRYAEIVAPESGRILKRWIETSELVTPGKAVITMGVARSGWVLRVGLSDRDVVQLHPGDRAEVVFDAYPAHTFVASVTEIADAADAASGTFEVELAVEDPDGLLKSGFIATADLYPSSQATYHRIPIEALVEGNGYEGVVYAISEADGHAHRTPVRIARLLDTEVVVAEGLDGIAEVVTDGAPYLTDETPVRIAE